MVAFCLAFAVPAYAQTGKQTPPERTGPQVVQKRPAASAATTEFVEKAAISDLFEVQSNKLALDKSKNDDIGRFAQQMVDDHTRTSDQLKSMAQSMQGIQLPSRLDKEHQDKLQQLQDADGDGFYQLYRTQQIEAHQNAVRLFDNYAKNGDAPELKSWAQKTLPTLQRHLQHAQALPQTLARVSQAPNQTGQAQNAQRNRTGDKAAPFASASSNHMMASDLRGTTVYGANNENIGEIDDIVLQRDGEVAAVVVGVGGFLGIGEKKVAIPFDALEIQARGRDVGTTGRADRTKTATGTVEPDRIVLRGMIKEELEAAPAFKAAGN